MDFSILPEGNHLTVSMRGAPSEREIRSMLEQMLVQSRGGDFKGALVEVRVAFGLDLVSSKDLVVALPAMGFAPGYKFAVLLMDEAGRDAAYFAENVAQNRAIGVRVFRERAHALEWLLE
jgi:hypothetical protein